MSDECPYSIKICGVSVCGLTSHPCNVVTQMLCEMLKPSYIRCGIVGEEMNLWINTKLTLQK